MKTIILAGGSGTRLWPLSRERYPKQFIKLNHDKSSLFQETFERSVMLSKLDDVYVVTNSKYKFLVMGEIEELGYNYNEENIIVEPEPKNTLPAIYAGVHEISKKGNDIIVVFPSDHMISNNSEFIDKINDSVALTENSIITFGIKPDSPNIGYGYIAPGKIKLNGYEALEFKEKPDYQTAVKYINRGYCWNSGIFMFNSEIFINETRLHSKNIYQAFNSTNNINEAFAKIKDKISIDYGIMEKSKNIAVVPVDIGWNDLGSFDSIYEASDKDSNNNIMNDETIAIDSHNNYIYSEKGKLITAIGVDNLIVVDNRDALLICKKDQSQKVKEIVDVIKSRNDIRTEYHVQDYRPWGSYKILEEDKNSFKIKHINVSAGRKLSYQMHRHRSEHWIVLKGTAIVTIDDIVKVVASGESIFIKPGQKHRLENSENTHLEIIEVQMGDYLEEDDIVRFEDDYDRSI